MDTTFAEAIQTSKAALKQSRDMIKYKGGIATDDKGLVALPEMIRTIPGTGVTTVTYFDNTMSASIPKGSTKYAYLAEFGGTTYSGIDYNDPDAGLWNEAPEYFSFFGDEPLPEDTPEDEIPPDIVIPPEILALPDFRQGINLQYYNKVDLVEQKYKRYMKTFTFDGSADEAWRTGVAEGSPSNYYAIRVGAMGVYKQRLCVSSNYPNVYITSSTTTVGIDTLDSSAFGGFVIVVRPQNVTEYTVESFKELLQANPITVRIATLVPEVSDLPVYMNPLIYLGAYAEIADGAFAAFITSIPDDGQGYPVKIIFETLDAQGG